MREFWLGAFVALALAVTCVTVNDRHAAPRWLSYVLGWLAPILVVVSALAAVAGVVTW